MYFCCFNLCIRCLWVVLQRVNESDSSGGELCVDARVWLCFSVFERWLQHRLCYSRLSRRVCVLCISLGVASDLYTPENLCAVSACVVVCVYNEECERVSSTTALNLIPVLGSTMPGAVRTNLRARKQPAFVVGFTHTCACLKVCVYRVHAEETSALQHCDGMPARKPAHASSCD